MSLYLTLIGIVSLGLLASYAQTDVAQQPTQSADGNAIATFAGGCFWCIEAAFQGEKGVIDAVSGYMGGTAETATYEQVSSGQTDHYEVVKVTYDPSVVSYEELLEIFFRYIDPTDDSGQFADKGSQYKTAIFVHSDEQRSSAKQFISALDASDKYDKPVVTEVLDAMPFYIAEEYHQNYFLKKTGQYERYYEGSGRKAHVDAQKKEEEMDLSHLTAEQIAITQDGATERPFANKYWNHYEKGIYVDVVSGEALFSSTHKYKSGTGWPSFTQPIKQNDLLLLADDSHGMERVEVKSADADSHLGHVFNDGPGPTGERFCINSGSLRFVPYEKMEAEGYSEYLYLFEE